jgi:HAD superfamily hydrolase (TIGR01509 family)
VASRFRAALLDLDGTLVDSISGLYEIYSELVREHGGAPTRAEFAELNGPPLAQVAAMLVERYRIAKTPDALLADYRARIATLYSTRLRPIDGAPELLERLAGDGMQLGLVTSAPALLATTALGAFGWQARFRVVSTPDCVARGKPFPDPYEYAMRRLDVPPDACVALEDSPHGVRAAAAAGARVIGFSPGGGEVELRDAGAVAVVRALAEVAGVVADLARSQD